MPVPRWSALVVLVACAGCNRQAFEPPKLDPTEVVVARPTPRHITDYEEFTGHTDAILSVQIKARVTGYLLKKDFQDGQDVKEGDILYEIDDRPYKAALDSAEATVAQGEAHRKRLAADYRRASNLFQRAAIGKQEFDLISSDFAEAEAQLGASKAQLDNARLNMSFTKVRAPMAGQLSRTLVDPGNLVKQDSTILTDVVSTNELYVYFDISVDAMDRITKVIELDRVGGKDGKKIPVVAGTSVDADLHEEDQRALRDLGDELKQIADRRKKLSLDGEAELKKIAKEGEDHLKGIAETKGGSLEELAGNLEARKKKLEADLAARKKKLEADLAENDKVREAKQKVLAEMERTKHSEFPYEGAVNFSEKSLDAATGTLRVRGTIKNPAPDFMLTPGLFVRVQLPIGDPHEALLVPEDSIGSDQGRSFVYAINPKDEVEYRPIELGALFEGDAGRKLRAIRKGIEAGDRFIQDSEALRRVRPGTKVKVIQPAIQIAATPSTPAS
jgi:multidrug efflux pump subunit AcrA (membrane-fusion protein)